NGFSVEPTLDELHQSIFQECAFQPVVLKPCHISDKLICPPGDSSVFPLRISPTARICQVESKQSQLSKLLVVWIHCGIDKLIDQDEVLFESRSRIEKEIHGDQLTIFVHDT